MTSMETTIGGVVPEWTVGDRLRKARTLADITTEDMAADIGRSDRTIRNYENDVTTTPLLVLRAYAFRTGVSLTWLQTGAIADDGGDGPNMPVTLGSHTRISGLYTAAMPKAA